MGDNTSFQRTSILEVAYDDRGQPEAGVVLLLLASWLAGVIAVSYHSTLLEKQLNYCRGQCGLTTARPVKWATGEMIMKRLSGRAELTR